VVTKPGGRLSGIELSLAVEVQGNAKGNKLEVQERGPQSSINSEKKHGGEMQYSVLRLTCRISDVFLGDFWETKRHGKIREGEKEERDLLRLLYTTIKQKKNSKGNTARLDLYLKKNNSNTRKK